MPQTRDDIDRMQREEQKNRERAMDRKERRPDSRPSNGEKKESVGLTQASPRGPTGIYR